MITDEIMEVLNVLGEFISGSEASLIECIKELFTDFDEYVWNGMSKWERRNWVEDYITKMS